MHDFLEKKIKIEKNVFFYTPEKIVGPGLQAYMLATPLMTAWQVRVFHFGKRKQSWPECLDVQPFLYWSYRR